MKPIMMNRKDKITNNKVIIMSFYRWENCPPHVKDQIGCLVGIIKTTPHFAGKIRSGGIVEMEDLISLKEQLRLLEERLLQPEVRQSVTELESK
jgi:hypothetical protein